MALTSSFHWGTLPAPIVANPISDTYQVAVRPLPSQSAAGKQYFYAAPNHPRDKRALLVLFHGTGGSARDWFHALSEPMAITRAALEKGFAVVGMDSDGDEFLNNIDLTITDTANPVYPHDYYNVELILDELQNQGVIRRNGSGGAMPDTVLCAVGGSNGANFMAKLATMPDIPEFAAVGFFIARVGDYQKRYNTDYLALTHVHREWDPVAQELDFSLAGIGLQGYVHGTVDIDTRIPPFFAVQAQHDSISPGALHETTHLIWNVRADSSGNLSFAERRDQEFRINRSKPLKPWLFTRIPRITNGMSYALFQALCNTGWLDPFTFEFTASPMEPGLPGLVTRPFDDVIGLVIEQLGQTPFLLSSFRRPIKQLCAAVYGEHAINSDFTGELIDFLWDHVEQAR